MRSFYTLAFVACVLSSLSGTAQVVSNFTSSNDGWIIADQNQNGQLTPTLNASGGNPGGFLSGIVADGNERYWFAPAKFLGNKAYTSFGETLSFDLQTAAASPTHSSVGDLVLSNGFQSLYLTLPSLPATAPAWTHFSIPLDETANWKQGSIGGLTATRDYVIATLSNLTTIRIYMQFKTLTVNVTGGIDNVVLGTHAPAPAPPVITSFSPVSAAPGSTLTIAGSGFGTGVNNNVVFFGTIRGAVQSASATQITVQVPVGADLDQLRVLNVTSGLMGASSKQFIPKFATGGGTTLIPSSFANYLSMNRTSYSLTHGDINGDGKPELILSEGSTVSVFENLTTVGKLDANSFGTRQDFTPSAAFQYSDVGSMDLDGDGKVDIYMAIRDNPDQGRVVVMPNKYTSGPISAASFGPSIDVTVPPYTASAAHAADLDGDGRPELISWGSSCGANPVYVMLNISVPGDIRFTTSFSLAGANSCGASYATADLDGDGKLDIIEFVETAARIFRNTSTPGALSFDAPFDLTPGNTNSSIADLDNDGKLDVVCVSTGLRIFKNNSTPGNLSIATFQPVFTIAGAINTAKIADMNGDGKPDIVSAQNGGLVVFQNVAVDGQLNTGSFRPPVGFDGGGLAATRLDLADFDLDGRPDVVTNNSNSFNVAIVKNIATAPPTVTNIAPKSATPGSTVTITGSNFSSTATDQVVYFGNAKASITNASSNTLEVTVPIGASYDQVSVAISGYTIYSKDFFTPTFSGGSDFSAGSFVQAFDRATGGSNGLSVGDFDADGKVDVLADAGTSLAILRNVGTTGTLDATTFAATTTTGSNGNLIKKGDIDGDGLIDLDVNFTIARNISSNLLPNPIAFGPTLTREGSNPSYLRMVFRDLNNDGKIDLMGTGGNVASLYVNGNQARIGDFAAYSSTFPSILPNVSFTRPASAGSLVAADFDGDGFNDVVTTNPSANSVSIFQNKQFTLPLASALFNSPSNITGLSTPTGIAVADFDYDGKPDFVVTNAVSASPTISVFRNTTVGAVISFARQDFAAGNTPTEVVVDDMDGDGKVDIIVANWGTGANSFSLFRNLSTVGTLTASSFAAKVDYAVASSPRWIAVGDIDGDTRPDIIVTRATANAVTVFKNQIPPGPSISVTVQPNSVTACENGNASFSTAATGANNLVFTWQVFNTNTSSFDNLVASATYSGVTTSTLLVSNIGVSLTGSIYRCKISGDNASDKFSNQVTLTTSPSPAAPTTSGATACKGSSLSLSASGGANGFYRWFDSPTAAQAIAGEVNATFQTPVVFSTTTFYAAIANANGCVSARTAAVATITPLTKPAISAPGTTLCGQNQITISGPGGFAAYNWSNGETTQNISVTFTGSYSLIVQDANGCNSLASDPVVITSGSVPKPVIDSPKNRLCSAGDQLTLTAPAGYAGYEWSNGSTTQTINVTTNGAYSVKVINASGCKSASSDDFVVTTGAQKPTISVGADVLVSSPAKLYQWYYGDVAIPDGTKQFLKYNPFQYGVYRVSVTDFSDCVSTSDNFVNLVTGLGDVSIANWVYPNPFSQVLTLSPDVEEASLLDFAGRTLIRLNPGDNDVSALSQGVYVVRFKKNQELISIKMTK